MIWKQDYIWGPRFFGDHDVSALCSEHKNGDPDSSICTRYGVMMQEFIYHCITMEILCLKPLRVQFEGPYAVSEVSNIKPSLFPLPYATTIERRSPSPRAASACPT